MAESPKKKSKFRKILKWAGITAAGLTLTGFLTLLGYGGYKYHTISSRIGDEIKKENIVNSLYQETEIFHNDGESKISSIAGNENGNGEIKHRKYVKITPDHEDEDFIPQHCIDELVAMEDDHFFEHSGFNYKGIARAAYHYLILGKKEGGSSLTQQTAENLFKSHFENSPSSLQGKIEEAVYAIKLEQNFSKEEILEFYLNQFHVIANAVGISNASKYYFNKEVKNLDEIECAFIVAQVKGPRLYDPFKPDDTRRKALNRGKNRTLAVLKNTQEEALEKAKTEQEEKTIKEKYDQLIAKVKEEGLPFNHGEFKFSTNTLADLVKKELTTPEIKKKLREYGITPEEIGTAGLRIITTLDKEAQTAAEYHSRRKATEKDIQLRGYQKPSNNIKSKKPEKPQVGSFHFGKYLSFSEQGMILDAGILDLEAFQRVVQLDKQSKLGDSSTEINQQDLLDFIKQFQKGDTVYYSVREFAGEKVILDFEQQPAFELASLFLDQNGKIISLMGSYDNKNFNYIFDGKRQPGSAMKPLVDWIALELGANLTDKLWNFPYPFWNYNEIFTVRNYSQSEHEEITLWNALVKSKNIPHVDLFYELPLLISEDKFKQIAQEVGYGRQEDEPQPEKLYSSQGKLLDQYIKRIRDKEGIQWTSVLQDWTKFNRAKKQYLNYPDLTEKEKEFVKNLIYPYKIQERLDFLEKLNGSKSAGKEESLRKLHINWPNYQEKRKNLETTLNNLQSALENSDQDNLDTFLKDFYAKTDAEDVEIVFAPDFTEELTPLNAELFHQIFTYQGKGTGLLSFEKKFDSQNIILGDGGSIKTIDTLTQLMENQNLGEDYYTLDNLIYHPQAQLRILERYIQKRFAQLGVELTERDLNTIIALGAPSVNPEKMLLAYSGIFKGELIQPYIVERIENKQGKTIYQAEPKKTSLDIDPKISFTLAQVLHAVATRGTAGFLNSTAYNFEQKDEFFNPEIKEKFNGKLKINIQGQEFMVRAAGKTGTTNNYTNAWFIGCSGQELKDQLCGVVWMGEYKKNNSHMKNKNNKILGSTAAHLWGDIIKEIIQNPEYQKALDPNKRGPTPPDKYKGIFVYDKTGEKVDIERCLPVKNNQNYCFNGNEIEPISIIYSF